MTVVATVCPAAKFRFDVPGQEAPDGHTVAYPAARGATTVTVSTTAAAPFAGMPPIPVTFTAAVADAGTAPGICHPSRESATLAGVTVAIVPVPVGVPARMYALTSTINCTPPPEPLKTRIFPSASNGTTIVLAMV